MTRQHVPIPTMLRRRPRFRGLPIPYVGACDPESGRPLFGFNNLRRLTSAVERRVCGQCEQPLVGALAFIGGEAECHERLFKEPPMHLPCARYVLSVCPYFSRQQHGQTRLPPTKNAVLLRFGDEKLPPLERWSIFQTRSFKTDTGPQGQLIFRVGEPVAPLIYFKHGREVKAA